MPELYSSRPRRSVRSGGVGKTSFYGVCGDTSVKLHPDIHFGVPINDLYGPHIHFGYEKDKK